MNECTDQKGEKMRSTMIKILAACVELIFCLLRVRAGIYERFEGWRVSSTAPVAKQTRFRMVREQREPNTTINHMLTLGTSKYASFV